MSVTEATHADAPVHPDGLEFQYLFGGRPPKLSPYRPMWDYQREVQAKVAAHEIPNQVLYVEHEPVYTAGRHTDPAFFPVDGTEVIQVDRGGQITWHGPGQLVGYPIVFLPRRVGVVDYVRRVEEAIIRYLATVGVRAGRVPDRTGVWLPPSGDVWERKICAIGVRVAKRTTMHGFALNVVDSLERFTNIVPCGIDDAGVTSIKDEFELLGLGTPPTLDDVAHGLEPFLTEMMKFEPYEQSPDAAEL